MNTLLSLLTPFQWGAVAVAAVAIVWLYSDKIFAMFPAKSAVPTTTATVKAGVPTRRQALDYLDALYAYFESEKCKEGMDAIRLSVTHAFHEHDAQGNAVATGGK